jgi:hypothetical protein
MERACWALFLAWVAEGVVVAPIGDYSVGSGIYRILVHSLTYLIVGRLLYLTLVNVPLLRRTAQQKGVRLDFVGIIAFLSLLEVVNGVFHADDLRLFPLQMLADLVPLVSCLLVYVGAVCVPFRDSLKRMIGLQALMTGALIVWVLWRYPVELGRASVSEPHFFGLTIGGVTVIGLASIHMLRGRDKAFVVIGFVCQAILMLAYQSRGGSINTFLIFPLTLAIAHVKAGTFSRRALWRVAFVGIPCVALLLFTVSKLDFLSAQARLGSEGTSQRLFQNDRGDWDWFGLAASINDEVDNSRGLEAQEFISKATPFMWMFGHGMGGTWRSDVMNGGSTWPMVHFGPLHMVLKGGLIMAFLYMGMFLVAIWRSWRALGSNPWAITSLSCLVFYCSDFLKHGPVVHSYYNSLNWLVLGIGLSCLRPACRRILPAALRDKNWGTW